MFSKAVMWVATLLLISVCVFQTSAKDQHCQISDQPSCSINPKLECCSLTPGCSRSVRAVKQENYHPEYSRRSVRATKQKDLYHGSGSSKSKHKGYYDIPSNSRFVRSTTPQDYMDGTSSDVIDLQQQRYSRHFNQKLGDSIASRGLPQDETALSQIQEDVGRGFNKPRTTTHYLTKATFCPYCRQMLPSESSTHQQPMDPNRFRQQRQRNSHLLKNPYSQPKSQPQNSEVHPDVDHQLNTSVTVEETCPFDNGMKQEEAETSSQVSSNIGYNQTVHQIPMPNLGQEFQKPSGPINLQASARAKPSNLSPEPELPAGLPTMATSKYMALPNMKELLKNMDLKRST